MEDKILDEIFPNLRAWHDKHGELHTIGLAKRQILSNYTPNTEVEQQVLIGRIDELESLLVLNKTIYGEESQTMIKINNRLITLKAQLKEGQ